MIKYIYKFSIIMAVYNVEEYLEEAIDSVIDQSLDFKENVQLILVNDGSTDDSSEICKKYVEKYPDNIEYHEKLNGGPSSAKNFGLNFVRGEYLNFFDSDDILSKDALSAVANFFEKYKHVNIVGLVVEYFGAKEGIHPRYEIFGKETTVVNLNESPQNYILSVAATFYKTELFDSIRFDTNLVAAEDVYANCQMYLENRFVGIIGHDEAVYNYRIRKKQNSISDKTKHDADSFIYVTKYLYENFMRILSEKEIEMPEFLKYILLGEIKKRNKALNTLKGEKLKVFHKLCAEILSHIEDKYIQNFYDPDHMIKVAFFALKYEWDFESIEYKIHDKKLYANDLKIGTVRKCKMILSKYDLKENSIKLTGAYNDILPINANESLRFKDSRGKTYTTSFTLTDNKFFRHKMLGIKFNNQYKFEIELPVKNATKYIPILKVAGIEIPANFITMQKFFKMDDYINSEEIYTIFNKEKGVNISNESIAVFKKNILNKVMYEIERIKYIKRVFNVNWLYRLLARRKKQYILFNDRPMVGDDNAQALFEYVCKNEKKIAKKCFFVISKDSKRIKELRKIGKVVKKGSFNHKNKFLNAKMIISSHANFYNPFNEQETECFKDLFSYKLIFLQNGVAMNDVHLLTNRCKSGIDMFVTSTKKEYEEIKTEKYMYDNEVVLTGLPRFDKLTNKKEKLILISPTWRTYLSGPINQQGFHDMIEGFENSEYYKRYNRLLTNTKLLTNLRENGYKVIFLLHPGFKLYEDYFKRLENDIVEIKNIENVKFSELFAKISLLVTDYSSIIFDTAYLKKPMLLYQFDSELYFDKQYKPGYFSYKNDAFGKVLKQETKLVEEIIKNIENGCIMEEEYVKRVDNTFYKIDKNNSKRVFEKIKEMFLNI